MTTTDTVTKTKAFDRNDHLRTLFVDVEKFKTAMRKKHLRVAKAKCPRCQGWLYGSFNGTKDHFHMRCDGDCKRIYME